MLSFEKCFIFPRDVLYVTSVRRNQFLLNIELRKERKNYGRRSARPIDPLGLLYI